MNITVSAEEEEVWKWRQAAVAEKKRFSEWVRGRLNTEVGRAIKSEKAEPKQTQEVKKPENQKGVEVAFKETKEVGNANTVEGAKERLAEMQTKKSTRMNTGESDAEFLKRQEGATKAMEKRYGK